MKNVVGAVLVCAGFSSLIAGCLANPVDVFDGSSSSSSGGDTPKECSSDADCAFRDTDSDPCTNALCQSGRCVENKIKNTPDCQCHDIADCTYFQKQTCNTISCDQHKCAKAIAPAGPAPNQKTGDCKKSSCDGINETGKEEADATDLPANDNPCVVAACSESGSPSSTKLADGTACNGDGLCFQGSCMTCKPSNPTSCGAEGPGEPSNDNEATPAAFPQHTPVCAFTSGTDTDWYTFHAEDKDLSHDVFNFRLWSKAPTLEICIYVKCGSGVPEGACATKIPGPNGSSGCCWSGEPSSLQPTWDMNCTGTNEDSGTAYVSIKAPGASACEPYAVIGGY